MIKIDIEEMRVQVLKDIEALIDGWEIKIKREIEGGCPRCDRDRRYRRRYYADNREKRVKSARDSRKNESVEQREKRRELANRYYKINRESILAKKKIRDEKARNSR